MNVEYLIRGLEMFERLRRLGPTSFQIILYMLQKGPYNDVSPSEISEKLNISSDSARKNIERLCKAGFLIRREKGSYILNLGVLLSAILISMRYKKIRNFIKKSKKQNKILKN